MTMSGRVYYKDHVNECAGNYYHGECLKEKSYWVQKEKDLSALTFEGLKQKMADFCREGHFCRGVWVNDYENSQWINADVLTENYPAKSEPESACFYVFGVKAEWAKRCHDRGTFGYLVHDLVSWDME